MIRVPAEKRYALTEMIEQIVAAKRKILNMAREPGFAASILRNRFFH